MKNLILASLVAFTASSFAAEPTPLQLARVLQIKSVQQALYQVEGSIGEVSVSYEFTGGMESAGYFISVKLKDRAKGDKTLPDCEINLDIIGPKYKDNGELNDVSFALSKEDLRTMPVTLNSCSANPAR